jgi:hypothetical protein
VDRDGRLPEGAWHGLVALTFAAFLVTVALWPSGPAAAPVKEPLGMEEAEGHAGHEGEFFNPTRDNIVGRDPYNGPVTAEEVAAACRAQTAVQECYKGRLRALLVGRGAGAAFDALDRLPTVDRRVAGQEHALAHDLGRLAYDAYGSVRVALQQCSYKVFQGCLHGAIESHFSSLSDVQPEDLDVCIDHAAVKKSTCVHGIGHGLMLYTNANVNASLAMCDWLDDMEEQSCWGGVFMENLVGHSDFLRGAQHHRAHANSTEPPGYMVEREGDPYYPCSVIATQYRSACWMQMADYILWRNRSDFREAARLCDEAPGMYVSQCRMRLGTDAYAWHNLTYALEVCGYGDPVYRPNCIRGIADEVVLLRFSPQAGLDACRQMPLSTDKAVCYRQVPSQGIGMVGRDAMEAMCAAVEPGFVSDCRQGAGLE